MLNIIIWALVAYFLYRFIFNFIVPLVITTRKFRSQMRDFQTNMQQQHQEGYDSYHSQPHQQQSSQSKGSSGSSSKESDYIDFEEIK